MMSNPFHYNRPVEPEHFVGRWPLVHRIADDLARVGGDSYAVVGGRRFGKSSLLLALQHQLAERLKTTPRGERHILPLRLDYKELKLDAHYRLYARVVEELRRVLHPTRPPRQRGPHLPLELDDALLDRLYPSDRPSDSLDAFKQVIGDVIDRAFDAYGPLCLVLLLDEVEEALDRPWTETLFNQLRALIYSSALVESLRLVIAGDDRVLKVRAQGSPLLNMLEPEYLAVLDEADTHQIIARAAGVPPAVADAVVRQSGGHPYLTQALMHELWEKDLTRATPESVEAVVHQLTFERRGILENWYNAIGPAGRVTYAVLAQASDGAWLSVEEVKAQVTDRSIAVPEGLTNLCYHGFAAHDDAWHHYRCAGTLFRDWFLEEHKRGNEEGRAYLIRLHQMLTDRFSEEELRTLCFQLGVDYEVLPGRGKADKARELVQYLERRDRVHELVEIGKGVRPDVPWEDAP